METAQQSSPHVLDKPEYVLKNVMVMETVGVMRLVQGSSGMDRNAMYLALEWRRASVSVVQCE